MTSRFASKLVTQTDKKRLSRKPSISDSIEELPEIIEEEANQIDYETYTPIVAFRALERHSLSRSGSWGKSSEDWNIELR